MSNTKIIRTRKNSYAINAIVLFFVFFAVFDNDIIFLLRDFFNHLQIQINTDFFVLLYRMFFLFKFSMSNPAVLSLILFIFSFAGILNLLLLSFYILATFVKIKKSSLQKQEKQIKRSPKKSVNQIYLINKVFLC